MDCDEAVDKPVSATALKYAASYAFTDSDEKETSKSVKVDCNTCSNRGRIDGLSQESHCSHCKWQEQWRTDHYAP